MKIKSLKLKVYIILRLLIILCMIRQIILGNLANIILCLITLILFMLPSILCRKFKIDFPDTLEIIIYIFIFCSEVLGEIDKLYIHIDHFDTIMHTINGILMSGIALSLINILNNEESINFSLKPIYATFFAFCFSMTTGVVWEVFEFSIDTLMNKDMQKDTIISEISSVKFDDKESKAKRVEIKTLEVNNIDYMAKYGGYIDIGLIDTMKDLIVNLIGALIYSTFGFIYLDNRGYIPKELTITRKKE